jgi:hypothetical protein
MVLCCAPAMEFECSSKILSVRPAPSLFFTATAQGKKQRHWESLPAADFDGRWPSRGVYDE